jgi:hypothetical protein
MITRSGQLLSDEKKDLSVHLLTHEKTIQSESLDTNTQITPNKDC